MDVAEAARELETKGIPHIILQNGVEEDGVIYPRDDGVIYPS
jgi:hypothetical protein